MTSLEVSFVWAMVLVLGVLYIHGAISAYIVFVKGNIPPVGSFDELSIPIFVALTILVVFPLIVHAIRLAL